MKFLEKFPSTILSSIQYVNHKFLNLPKEPPVQPQIDNIYNKSSLTVMPAYKAVLTNQIKSHDVIVVFFKCGIILSIWANK